MTTTYHIALDSIMPDNMLPAKPDFNMNNMLPTKPDFSMILTDYITPEFWIAAQDSIEKLHLRNSAEFGECRAVPLVMENGNLRLLRDDIEGPMLNKWEADNDTRIRKEPDAPTYHVSLVPEWSAELGTKNTFTYPGMQQEEIFAAIHAIRKYSREIDDFHPLIRGISIKKDMPDMIELPDPDHNGIFPGLLTEFRDFARILRNMMKDAGHKLESVLCNEKYDLAVNTFFNTLIRKIHGENHADLSFPGFRNDVVAYANTILESCVEVSPYPNDTGITRNNLTRNSLERLKQTITIHDMEERLKAVSRKHDMGERLKAVSGEHEMEKTTQGSVPRA